MNLRRRRFLKLLFLSGGAFFLGSLFSKFTFGVGKPTAEFRNFKAVEEGDKLTFYSRNGKRLFVLSEDGTLEVD